MPTKGCARSCSSSRTKSAKSAIPTAKASTSRRRESCCRNCKKRSAISHQHDADVDWDGTPGHSLRKIAREGHGFQPCRLNSLGMRVSAPEGRFFGAEYVLKHCTRYVTRKYVEYGSSPMAVKGNILIGPSAVSTCQFCASVLFTASICARVTLGSRSVTANNTTGPTSSPTVSACCRSTSSRRAFIGSSRSTRSPLFQCRRTCAKLPARAASRLPLTDIEAPSAHAGIRRLSTNLADFDAFTSNCTWESQGYSLFCVSAICAPFCVNRSVEGL